MYFLLYGRKAEIRVFFQIHFERFLREVQLSLGTGLEKLRILL